MAFKDQHLAAHMQVRMRVPFGGHGGLFGFREVDLEVGHP